MDLVYLAGAPATGKSTLMAELTRGARRVSCESVRLLPYDELWTDEGRVGVELGRKRLNFPGTDSLAMNVLPTAADWLKKQLCDVVLAEGDRLTHIRFLNAAGDAGYRVNLFVLQAPMNVLDERCTARGSNQSRSWRMSRGTLCSRVASYAEAAGHRVYYLNAEEPTRVLADKIRLQVPVLEQLKLRTEARQWQS